jgi:hypothetical protein
MSLEDYTKEELLAFGEQFGVEVKKTMNKSAIVEAFNEDGVTAELIEVERARQEEAAPVEEFEEPVVEAAVEEDDDEDDEDLVLVRMIRANATYEVRGYVFRSSHPFALVKEEDADYLIEHEGGFRMASPKEAREFYS